MLSSDAGASADVRHHAGQLIPFSAAVVNKVVRELDLGLRKTDTQRQWLSVVASHVIAIRPDLSQDLLSVLGAEPYPKDILRGLSIGEIGACYEALLSNLDRGGRRSDGQFFTPDDAACFMAERSEYFPEGVWLDPCCGVGNLSWYLAGAQRDSAEFVRDRLILVDKDETALQTAIALLAAEYVGENDGEAVRALKARSMHRDFLSRHSLPKYDFAIFNPPYARSPGRSCFETAPCHDLFAYFVERIAKESKGFIAVTPASYLSAPKFRTLRSLLDKECAGGDVLVFDNVPDTLFRGYKYGSNNTSKTNFVRAAITVCAPRTGEWRVSPIIRWQAASRARMFEGCMDLLAPRRIGPNGEWAKIGPGMDAVWDVLASERKTLKDLVVNDDTDYRLEVALTPRYFISATFRSLDRGSKAVLHFRSSSDRDLAALVLNSSIPYLWWRALDGGVTLPKRVLFSVPIPEALEPDSELISRLRVSEDHHVVVKVNAGRVNENVKHPKSLVDDLNDAVIPGNRRVDLRYLYSSNMFPLS